MTICIMVTMKTTRGGRRVRERESEDQSVGWALEGENIRRLLKKKPLKKRVHAYHTLDARCEYA